MLLALHASFILLSINILDCESHVLVKRVIGGIPISISDVPWMAMITKKDGTQYCGGTIISAKAVLTTAHCVLRREVEDVVVVVGVSKKDEVKPGNRFSVKSFVPHPDYNSSNYQNDIAIIVLEKNIDLDKYPPIKLSISTPQNITYKKACVAGWGFLSNSGPESNQLNEVCFTANDFSDCSLHWGNKTDPSTQLCVGAKGKDTCNGDAGGPLYIKRKNKPIEIGISSYGRGCGNGYSVYTRVSEFQQWIKDSVKNL